MVWISLVPSLYWSASLVTFEGRSADIEPGLIQPSDGFHALKSRLFVFLLLRTGCSRCPLVKCILSDLAPLK
jgi:hypothetical protein